MFTVRVPRGTTTFTVVAVALAGSFTAGATRQIAVAPQRHCNHVYPMRTASAITAAAGLLLTVAAATGGEPIVLNDVHSRLHPTRVASVEQPESVGELAATVRRAAELGLPVSISGGRHAMGGQQFAEGSLHISTARLNSILGLDRDKGIVTAEAGVQWPELIDYLVAEQAGNAHPWGISQKQTGADALSLGGALSANVHGRSLDQAPIVADVEAFSLVRADGSITRVSRSEQPELFGLAIGGYGLFGVIATVELRLVPRTVLQRVVEVVPLNELAGRFEQRIADGFLYGDCQFNIDPASPDFLGNGVFSCYRPAAAGALPAAGQRKLQPDDWNQLLADGHTDKAAGWTRYRDYYLSTDGQLYWSDTHQLSYYNADYESYLSEHLPNYLPGSLVITEAYVPRDRLADFMENCADDFREHRVDLVYGTIRLIRRDTDTFLPWAKQDYACVIFNLRVAHDETGLNKARSDFRRIIDRAIERDGSYYLTYHRWARKDQLLGAYPQFPRFLEIKRKYDPEERFQSEWYRHYREMFAVPETAAQSAARP